MESRFVPAPAERRANRRLLCSEIVNVDLYLPDGDRISAKAIVNDISPGGLCLQFDGPVSSSGFVSVEAGDGTNLIAAIRHTSVRDGSYFLGASFVNFLWSPDMGWPRHCIPTLHVSAVAHDEESDLLRIARAVRQRK